MTTTYTPAFVRVDAFRWLGGGKNVPATPPWLMNAGIHTDGDCLQLRTIRGSDCAKVGDFIVRTKRRPSGPETGRI